jgi:hypothetical protein
MDGMAACMQVKVFIDFVFYALCVVECEGSRQMDGAM